MALHPDFPGSPHAILEPDVRWFPADEQLREIGSGKLLPPLVSQLRKAVKQWRDNDYNEATETSRSLLNWWFNIPHLVVNADGTTTEFQYYFAQREVIETIIYLYEVVGVKDKYDMIRFDSSGTVSSGMFDENWKRFVVKMATGTGKTKVMSLVLTWSYFNKLYENESELARNFLLIAPNIIVLDRLRKDFEGLRIFYEDPILPDNGMDGRNWRNDFQLTVHIQDEVRITRPLGNIFLTNIHRIYTGDDTSPSSDDENKMNYFLGKKPTGATSDSRVDLGAIVRDVDELLILNDEAHHIHDDSLAWFQCIRDINNRLLQKGGSLALQVDTTATPKDKNGAIFVQTISDYPLVEAISQNVVKHPVLPDAASRAKLNEKQSIQYTEKYSDYLHLGVIEWRKAYKEHQKLGKKAIFFVMTDDTKNCDSVAAYLEKTYADLEGAVLVIHTKKNGEISESSSARNKDELEELRRQANDIDGLDNPYKAIVSVLMLKEGWDVRNVTTIVGLRPYTASSNILPEQTLGRGLRRMYPHNDAEEIVSVVGTDAFMEFVESIQTEGVELERAAMGKGTDPKAPLIIEIDRDNKNKDMDTLDIEIPVLTNRIYREYKNLEDLNVGNFDYEEAPYKRFTEDQHREIVFKDITTGDVTHITTLDTSSVPNYSSVVGYFTKTIMKDLRLFSGYEVLYGKVKGFVKSHLFGREVELDNPDTLRNLSELTACKTLIDAFKKAINELTVQDRGNAEIRDTIKLREIRPCIVKQQDYLIPEKSVFNKIVGDSHLELMFARFLEECDDVISYAKNSTSHFRVDYVNADGNISNYYPDFLVKKSHSEVFIVETKGQKDVDVDLKIDRLKQWCEDANRTQSKVTYDFVYVDEKGFYKYHPKSFQDLAESFREYK